MQKAITLQVDGLTLRGMEHIPEGTAGKKLPVAILFHGFTGNKLEPHRFFLKICRALEQIGIASIRFDFSGSGESDGDFEQVTVSQELHEAKAILDWVKEDNRFDTKQIVLIGFSVGGLVAGVLAGQYSQQIAKLVLISAAGNLSELLLNMARQSGIRVHSDFQAVDHGGNLVGRDFVLDALQIDGFSLAKDYKGPVLLIHGTEDPTVPFATSERYQKVFQQQAVFHPVQGADHTFNKVEWEQEVMTTVCSFILQE